MMDTVNLLFVLLISLTSVISFSWNSCSTSSDSIRIIKLHMTEKNKELLITGRANLKLNLTSPIKGRIQIRRRSLTGWTKIPCIDNIGSCTYNDVCEFGQKYETKKCPKIFSDNNLPCHCPLIKGLYSAKRFPINLDRIPEWLGKGQYKLKGALYSSKNKELLCLNVDIAF